MGAVRWLSGSVTKTVKVGCLGFTSHLGHAVHSLLVVSVYRAGCLDVIVIALVAGLE